MAWDYAKLIPSVEPETKNGGKGGGWIGQLRFL